MVLTINALTAFSAITFNVIEFLIRFGASLVLIIKNHSKRQLEKMLS